MTSDIYAVAESVGFGDLDVPAVRARDDGRAVGAGGAATSSFPSGEGRAGGSFPAPGAVSRCEGCPGTCQSRLDCIRQPVRVDAFALPPVPGVRRFDGDGPPRPGQPGPSPRPGPGPVPHPPPPLGVGPLYALRQAHLFDVLPGLLLIALAASEPARLVIEFASS